MNDKKPTRIKWKDVVEGLEMDIGNTEIRLALLKAQLKTAMEHSGGS